MAAHSISQLGCRVDHAGMKVALAFVAAPATSRKFIPRKYDSKSWEAPGGAARSIRALFGRYCGGFATLAFIGGVPAEMSGLIRSPG
jgi:hypothetical protein